MIFMLRFSQLLKNLLPGLPEAYHPQTDRRAHEETAGECDAIGAKKALIYAAFRAEK